MEEKRKSYRVPVKGTAKFNSHNNLHGNELFITNLGSGGVGVGIPYQYDFKRCDNFVLKIAIPPIAKSMIMTGQVQWTNALNCYHDYAIVGGIKFSKTNSAQNWELLDTVYSKWRAELSIINDHFKSSTHETSFLSEPSIDVKIIKALNGFSIVESVITTRNTLVIKVDNEQWVNLDKVQKKIFVKTIHAFINANVTVENIHIKNKQGE